MAKRTWTAEQRQRQSEIIRQWQPWLQSTGPRTAEGKAKVSRNAYMGNNETWVRLHEAIAILKAARIKWTR